MEALARPEERRAHGRVAVEAQDEAVWLVLADGKRLLGYVADRGDGGARVELIGETDDLFVGQEAGLAFASAWKAGETAAMANVGLPRGEVVWMNGVNLGLKFLLAPN